MRSWEFFYDNVSLYFCALSRSQPYSLLQSTLPMTVTTKKFIILQNKKNTWRITSWEHFFQIKFWYFFNYKIIPWPNNISCMLSYLFVSMEHHLKNNKSPQQSTCLTLCEYTHRRSVKLQWNFCCTLILVDNITKVTDNFSTLNRFKQCV